MWPFLLLAPPSMKILLEALSFKKNKATYFVPPKEAFTFANSIDLILEAAGSSPRSLINTTTPSTAGTSGSLGQDLLLGSSLTLTESLATARFTVGHGTFAIAPGSCLGEQKKMSSSSRHFRTIC